MASWPPPSRGFPATCRPGPASSARRPAPWRSDAGLPWPRPGCPSCCSACGRSSASSSRSRRGSACPRRSAPMTEAIHPSALIDPRARLGARVRVGAYSVVGPDVTIGDDVELGHHVVLEGQVDLAASVRIGHGAVVGGVPQDLKFKDGTPSGVRIGTGTVLREYVTVHRATTPEGWTEIGRACLIMGLAHVAHDCRLGDHVIVINYAGLTGHCHIEDRVTVGGMVGMVPFTRIGTGAYVGGMAKINADIPPYMIVDGQPATARGVNVIGIRRAGMGAP